MATQSIMSPTTTIEALNRTLQTAPLDPVILAIANDYLSGKDIDTIADEYGISTDRVTSALDKKEVKNYVDSVFATQGYLNRVKRINLINRVIDQKLEEAMETGIYSKKDLLDWMKHLAEVEDKLKPTEKGPAVAIQVNNYDRLMRDLLE
jgi:hypothetical protein